MRMLPFPPPTAGWSPPPPCIQAWQRASYPRDRCVLLNESGERCCKHWLHCRMFVFGPRPRLLDLDELALYNVYKDINLGLCYRRKNAIWRYATERRTMLYSAVICAVRCRKSKVVPCSHPCTLTFTPQTRSILFDGGSIGFNEYPTWHQN